MQQNSITGLTSLFHAPVHQVSDGTTTFDARQLAHSAMPGPISALASAPVLRCLECGELFSALDLYLESPLAGECTDCAAEADMHARTLLSA